MWEVELELMSGVSGTTSPDMSIEPGADELFPNAISIIDFSSIIGINFSQIFSDSFPHMISLAYHFLSLEYSGMRYIEESRTMSPYPSATSNSPKYFVAEGSTKLLSILASKNGLTDAFFVQNTEISDPLKNVSLSVPP